MPDKNCIPTPSPSRRTPWNKGKLIGAAATQPSLVNPRARLMLLGHTKIESTVRYLGIEVDDALSMAEQVEV
jgi:hypothetical protein